MKPVSSTGLLKTTQMNESRRWLQVFKKDMSMDLTVERQSGCSGRNGGYLYGKCNLPSTGDYRNENKMTRPI